jgi:hypothetical protein
MARSTFYLGRWINYSGWRPDYKRRLYNRNRARWKGSYVHETLEIDGDVQRIAGNVLHYTVRDAAEHHLRMDRYTTLAAEQAYMHRESVSLARLLLSPMLVFVRSYVLKLGFLDGVPGLAIARFAAHYDFLKKLKLWEMRLKRDE